MTLDQVAEKIVVRLQLNRINQDSPMWATTIPPDQLVEVVKYELEKWAAGYPGPSNDFPYRPIADFPARTGTFLDDAEGQEGD